MKNFLRFSLQDLSRYRAELMGWAILWVMVMHFQFHWLTPLGFLSQFGFAGVEIFLFVSGFGLYFSLDKHPAVLPFWRKRVLRIFPEYYLLGIASCLLIYHDTLFRFLFRYSTIGYWTGGIYADWYIPALIALYVASPLVWRWVKSQFCGLLAVVCVAILALSYWLVPREDLIDTPHFFLLYRVPAFVFGMVCARWVKEGRGERLFFLIMLIGIPLFVVLFPQHHVFSRFKIYGSFYLLPLFLYVFCLLSRWLGGWSAPVRSVGEASLEVYLVQNIFLQAQNRNMLPLRPEWQDVSTLLIVLVSCIVGIAVHYLWNSYVTGKR